MDAQTQRGAMLLANEVEELARLNDRLSELLTQTANALKGDPGPNRLHSWHDLPDVAALAMKTARATLTGVNDRVTQSKAVMIATRDDSNFTGHILTDGRGDVTLIDKGAVLWMSNDDFWRLMHPTMTETWAPERIWLQREFGQEGSHTWCAHPVSATDEPVVEAEYRRVDATRPLR